MLQIFVAGFATLWQRGGMKLKLNSDTSEGIIVNLNAVNEDQKAKIRDLEAKIRGFLVIKKERDALKAENLNLRAELDWYIKKYGKRGLSG